MKTYITLFSLLILTNTFAGNSSVKPASMDTIVGSKNLEQKAIINDSLNLSNFPKALAYTASLSYNVKLRNKKDHKVEISYFKKNSNDVLFKELHKDVSIVENQVALKLGKGKAKKIKHGSLQELFANNLEVEMSWTIDGTVLYPKIGILPAGHSQKSGLLLKGESIKDKDLHWKGFNNPSTISSFRATQLTSDKTTLVNTGAIRSNPYEAEMNGPYLSIPVKDMPLATPSTHAFQDKEITTLRHEDLYDKNGNRYGTKSPKQKDSLAENSGRNPGGFRTPATNINVPGMPNISGFYPPDIEGAVGVDYYVQMVNSTFAIYNKSDGTLAQAARNTNTLWASHGGRCQSDNDGDAIALYDEQAGRWVLTQFAVSAAPESVCFAISITGDPTGAYYTYDLAAARFPDYYKLGVWPVASNNAYFMGTNSGQQNQYDVYAIDRENMLLGLSARPAQFFQSYRNLLMPADVDGDTPPPANAPGLLYTFRDAGEAYFGNPADDSIDVYEFNVDWNTPANTTFTLAQVITNGAGGLSDFNWTVCGFFVSDCLPQGGTSVNIDSGSWWPQQRLQYRNFGGFETLVGVWTVDVLSAGDHAAPRWFELRRNIGAGSWNLRQEGTFAPDNDHRFNPSISMDGSENIGLGYSVTSSSSFPSIRYTVHDASVDPLGTMEAESTMVAGGGSQTGTANRWGDYASMDVDPVDGCTFWFTSEYYASTSNANWVTRIGSFKVPTCKYYAITAVDDSIEVCKADDTASFSLSLSNDFDATTNMSLSGCPAGASCSFSPNPVVNPTSTTVLNLSSLTGAAGGSHLMTATATDSVDSLATSDLNLSLYLFNGNPGTPTLSFPADGSFAASLGPNLSWSAVADGQDYLVEIDNDPAFGSLDFSTTVLGGLTTTASSGLSENTCYYWRVSPSNLCGSGTTSNVFEFYTGASQSTADFASTDVPKTIGTVPVTITSTLTISAVGAINDVNVVDIDMTHSYAGDLTLTLQSPSGTVVTIMNVGCGTDNNIDLSLDDEAAGTWGCAGGGPVGGGGTFQPSSALSAFDGEDANGVWTLTVVDGFNGDGGSLNGWGLNFENFTNNGDQCPSGFTLGGNVSGLTGSGLILQNNLGDNLPIAADGSFTFATSLADNDPYSVTVFAQPNTPSQTCTVANASGNIPGANVTNVLVSCTIDTFTVGGNVSGLTGSGLVLQNNAGDNLAIAANGDFTFTTPLVDLSAYVVTVLTDPSTPSQSCSVTNDSGSLAGVNVTNVSVSCSTDSFTIGGNVSGLDGSGLVLQNNAGDNLAIAANGGFTFVTPLVDLSSYVVTVLTDPSTPSQSCSVTNASGTLAGANVTNVSVSCSTNTFTVGGSVSGLAGSGLVLQNNAGDNLAIAANGGFTFVTPLVDLSAYVVTVLTQPSSPNQSCTVTNASGNLAGLNVVNVAISCGAVTYTVGGNVTGLSGSGLVLQNNNGDDLSIAADGSFTFATGLADLSPYSVTVLTDPSTPSQTCTVGNASGNIPSANVTNVSVSCTTDTFTVGGNVSGLIGSGLVLQNNAGDNLAIAANGGFTFTTLLVDLSAYVVTVLTDPSTPSQSCSVTNDSGSLAGVNVTNVSVTCSTDSFTVGGNVSGLTGSGLILQNNAGDNLAIAANGGFTFATALSDLSAYNVTVLTQPSSPIQSCSVTNASGTLAGANVSNVSVSCNLIPDILFTGTNLAQDVCINPGPTAINPPVTLTTTALNSYNNTINLAFNPILPTGINSGFSNNNFVPAAAPGTDSLLNLSVDNTATPGLNTITVEASGTGITTKSVDVDLNVIFGLASDPTNTAPINGSTGIATNTTLTWSAIAGASSYDVEISADASFTPLVASTTTASTNFTPGSLVNGTVYYWRVRASNTCGDTAYSVAVFETIGGGGSTTMSFCNSPNLAIPDDDANGTTDTINIGTSATISDIDISLDVTHTWVGDLIFTVENVSDTTEVIIIDRPGRVGSGLGCSRNDIEAIIDDEASDPVEDECLNNATPTIDGIFSPNNPLNAFDGQSLAGDWILTASDVVNNDDGTVNEWCVIATYDSGSGLAAADYSDLSYSYGVARHEGGGTSKLGNNWTADSSFVEDGDSGDDDGIVASGLWTQGSLTAVLDVTVNTAGYLSCWFDWNDDGIFVAGEESIASVPVSDILPNNISVTIPSTSFGDGNDDFLETRCRFYDAIQNRAPASPVGTALSGEVEDYKLPADQLTPVTLAYTKSVRSHSNFQLTWSTTTESGTIGFNVYGLENNVWKQLNAQPISAKGINSVSPHDYQFNAGSNQIEAYKIEELTVNGNKQFYGPYTSNLTYGKYPNNRVINWQSISQESNIMSNNRQNALRQGFDFIKVSVNQAGIQRISYEDLVSLGVDWQGVVTDDISVSFENKAIARVVSSGVFGPGSYIDFVGSSADTLYTKTNIYILKLDASLSRKEISVTDTTFNIDTSAYHMASSKRNDDVSYTFASPTDSPWFLQSMLVYTSEKVWSYPISAPYLLNNNIPSKLTVEAWGGTDWPQVNDHHLQVLLDNQLISDNYSDGAATINVSQNLNHAQVSGVSTITFKLPADTGVDYDLIQLDRFSLDYPSEIYTNNDKLSFVPIVNSSVNADIIYTNGFENNFTDEGFLVKGLSTQETTIYAVKGTNLYDFPLKKTNTVTGGYELEVPLLLSNGAKYYINSNDNLIHPSLSFANNSDLNLTQQYDYLMISHPDFTETLNQLVNYHQARGLKVLVVNIEDIYAQYSFHRTDANSIKTFIKDAASLAGIKTVLLVGSDTSDYLDNLGIGSKSFIPTLYFPTDDIVKYAPVDPLFVDTNNDLIPDLSIGRLPVRTNFELQNIINKIIQYDNRSYVDTAIFSTDRSSSFDSFSNQMVGLLPLNWQVEKAYINNLDVNGAQTTLINSIESGVSLTNFFGHSGPNTWSFEHLFDNNDVLALNNLNKPTLVNQFGCWNTYYVMPEFDTMAHHLMSLENKGAVAVLGASTLTQSNHESLLGNLLIPRMTQSNVPTGLAILQAKQSLANSHPNYLDVLLGWTLLGDPMTVLNQQ